MVLEKTNSDDELIDALRAEIDRLKLKIKDSNSAKAMELQQAAIKQSQAEAIDENVRRLTLEVTRLERVCKSQVSVCLCLCIEWS